MVFLGGLSTQFTVEQNVESNVAYKDLVATLGAYDVDRADNLRIRYLPPTYGELRVEPESKSVPAGQNCGPPPSGDGDTPRVPCGLETPHDQVFITSLVWEK